MAPSEWPGPVMLWLWGGRQGQVNEDRNAHAALTSLVLLPALWWCRVCKGDWVLFFPYVMGRTDTLWPDAQRFQPERFLDKKAKPSPFVFTAFQVTVMPRVPPA